MGVNCSTSFMCFSLSHMMVPVNAAVQVGYSKGLGTLFLHVRTLRYRHTCQRIAQWGRILQIHKPYAAVQQACRCARASSPEQAGCELDDHQANTGRQLRPTPTEQLLSRSAQPTARFVGILTLNQKLGRVQKSFSQSSSVLNETLREVARVKKFHSRKHAM